jgi:uncharacterized membrane protein
MLFRLEMNGAAISSGMGTCGMVGPIGVISGWFAPESTITPGALDWVGLLLIAIVLPAILSYLFDVVLRRIDWVKDGDMKLDM